MSDYKIVNGKKVRVCKFGCGRVDLVWSDDDKIFVEDDGTLHTPERCKSLKEAKQGKPKQDTSTSREARIEAVIKKIQSVITDLEDLKNNDKRKDTL